MRRPAVAIAIVFVLLSVCCQSLWVQRDRDNLACFLAGSVLLGRSTDVEGKQRDRAYQGLCAATGLQSAEALTLLQEYRDRPEEWSKLLTRAREMTEGLH
jgi:hypothetical protein